MRRVARPDERAVQPLSLDATIDGNRKRRSVNLAMPGSTLK
jgi:hypothetical protein